MAARLTLVTLECTPVDIAMSVVEQGGLVYSPAVLRLRAHVSPTRYKDVGCDQWLRNVRSGQPNGRLSSGLATEGHGLVGGIGQHEDCWGMAS